ncbi:hypothetical protein KCP71_10005 [Salmonella enterica subsp. enterica]|nr:hypothetical protein KCP71_10005 [Salmonella enterica subsp. enterica]
MEESARLRDGKTPCQPAGGCGHGTALSLFVGSSRHPPGSNKLPGGFDRSWAVPRHRREHQWPVMLKIM